MKTKIDELKIDILVSAKVLNESSEEDIEHDFGSMEKFLEMMSDEISKLMNSYDYKLS